MSELAKQHFYLFIMDENGDSRMKIEWDPEDEKAVEEMRNTFADLKKLGYIFFETESFDGEYEKKGDEIKDFKEDAGMLIAEKHFSNLEHSEAEEVVLKKHKGDLGNGKMIDPEKENPKDGAVVGGVKTVSGG